MVLFCGYHHPDGAKNIYDGLHKSKISAWVVVDGQQTGFSGEHKH